MKTLFKLTVPVTIIFALSSNALASDDYFKLTTQFRESKNECLEGNQVNGSLNGAAFMDKCQNVSGQLWKLK